MAAMTAEDEDELWRLLKPGSRQTSASTSSQYALDKYQKMKESSNNEPKLKGKLGKAQQRVDKLEREHTTLLVPASNESEEQALERILQLSEVASQLTAAKEDVNSLQGNSLEQDLKDRLAMTNTALLARAESDQSNLPRFNIAAPLFQSNQVKDEEFIAQGVPLESLPPGIIRPKDETEHERIVRVARHVCNDISLINSLLQEKGHDPKFGFLKSHHPLNEYFNCLLSMGPAVLDHLVASAVQSKAMNEPIDMKSLESLGNESDQSNAIGQAIYPKFLYWFGEELAPKLVGMMLALPRDQLMPLLVDCKSLKETGASALAAFEKHSELS